MQAGLMEHAGDDLLERYTMGALPESELGPLEEHLLICRLCRDKLQDEDDFVRAIRAAAGKLNEKTRPARRRWRGTLDFFLAIPKPVWALGSALLVVSALWMGGVWDRSLDREGSPVAVVLHSARGQADPGASRAPAGKSLLLVLDVTGIPGQPPYALEIVDAAGGTVWETVASARNGRLSVPVSASLDPGRYWVRLYQAEPQRELLREFALDVRK